MKALQKQLREARQAENTEEIIRLKKLLGIKKDNGNNKNCIVLKSD